MQQATQQNGQPDQDHHFLVYINGPKRSRLSLVRGVRDEADAVRCANLLPDEAAFYTRPIAPGDHLLTADDRLARVDSFCMMTSLLRLSFWNGEFWLKPQVVDVVSIKRVLAAPTADSICATSLDPTSTWTLCGHRIHQARTLHQRRAATCPVCRAAAERARAW